MRIRTIKPEFFTHEELFELEAETGLPVRLAFAGLWCAADREGRFKWHPRRLGVQILPYDRCDFSRVLDALATRGFIRKYTSEGEAFGVIINFLKHQVINNREKASEIPSPNGSEDCDASSSREERDNHASKAEGKGRERKGREWKGMEGEGNTPIPPPEAEAETKPLCTLAQALAYAPMARMSLKAAEHWWHTRNAAGWTRSSASGGHPRRITSWQSDMATSVEWAEEGAAKTPSASTPKPSRCL